MKHDSEYMQIRRVLYLKKIKLIKSQESIISQLRSRVHVLEMDLDVAKNKVERMEREFAEQRIRGPEQRAIIDAMAQALEACSKTVNSFNGDL